MAETPIELAEAYIEALECRVDDGEFEAAQDRLDGLRERLKRFNDTYGDSDPATQELREKVKSTESEVEELKRDRREPEEFERELLEAATSFMLDEEWLQPGVIESLNRALVGSTDPALLVDDVEVARPEDIADLNDLTRYDIIDVIRKLALDKLGEANDLERVWQSIEGTTKEEPFKIVAEIGEANPDDIMESMGEDIDRGVARNRLKSAVYQLDISPYHREDGTYYLSTAGRYIAAEYAGTLGASDQESADEITGDQGQMRLDEENVAVNGGDVDE